MNKQLLKARAMLGCPFPEPEHSVKIQAVKNYTIYDSNSTVYYRDALYWSKRPSQARFFNTWDEANNECENVAGHILIVPMNEQGQPLPGAKPPTAGAVYRGKFLEDWKARQTVMIVKSK